MRHEKNKFVNVVCALRLLCRVPLSRVVFSDLYKFGVRLLASPLTISFESLPVVSNDCRRIRLGEHRSICPVTFYSLARLRSFLPVSNSLESLFREALRWPSAQFQGRYTLPSFAHNSVY